MSHKTGMIFVGMLIFGFVAIPGCGGSKPPEPEKGTSETKPNPTTNVNSNTITETRPEPEKLVHNLDPAKHVIPSASVIGTVAGAPFVPNASIEGDELIFRTVKMGTNDADREIRLKLGSSADPHPFENRKLTITQDMAVGPEVPEVLVEAPTGKLHLYPNGYGLTLELGSRQDGKLPGKIYLCLPGDEKSMLAGVFRADYPRQPTEAPGPADLPYIKGLVNVIGAVPNTTLRVGFVGYPSSEVGSADAELREPVTPIRWTQSDRTKPPVTTLIAGDGKNTPSRYEFSKLPTGRYLVFAVLAPAGPVAWKWVTILPGESHTVDLTIDTTQTGGVEVSAPLEAVKTVQIVPADKPDLRMHDSTLFAICNLQLGQFGLEKPIIARKALYKHLTPGQYEVKAGGQTRVVEIIAGKTLELDFEKPATVPAKTEAAPEPRPNG